MSMYRKIEEIVSMCEAILEASGLYLDNKKVSPDEWRAFMKRRRQIVAELAQGTKIPDENEKGENKVNEDEEPQKKHWTQHQPSKSNEFYQRKYGSKRNLNPNQQGQDTIRKSYNNYLDQSAAQLDPKAMEMYLQAKKEVGKLVALAKKGSIPWTEVNKAQRDMQKLRPAASSEFTQDKFNKNQEKRYGENS